MYLGGKRTIATDGGDVMKKIISMRKESYVDATNCILFNKHESEYAFSETAVCKCCSVNVSTKGKHIKLET